MRAAQQWTLFVLFRIIRNRWLICMLMVLLVWTGKAVATTSFDSNDEKEIVSFVQNHRNKEACFHVQGWRWHTMTLLRDMERLEKLSKHLLNGCKDPDILLKAIYHVVDFNMKSLHQVENDLFFPWATNNLIESLRSEQTNVMTAFMNLINMLHSHRLKVAQLGQEIRDQEVDLLDDERMVKALTNIVRASTNIVALVTTMFDKEERLLVPALALLISESEQIKFNHKVLFHLGIFNSRIHLVGMYDTLWQNHHYYNERTLFEQQIPILPRMMIPRWKRTLYQPQAGCLDF